MRDDDEPTETKVSGTPDPDETAEPTRPGWLQTLIDKTVSILKLAVAIGIIVGFVLFMERTGGMPAIPNILTSKAPAASASAVPSASTSGVPATAPSAAPSATVTPTASGSVAPLAATTVAPPAACDLIGVNQVNDLMGVSPALTSNPATDPTMCFYDNGKGQSVSVRTSSGPDAIPASLASLRKSLVDSGVVVTDQPRLHATGVSFTTPDKGTSAAFELNGHLFQVRTTGLNRTQAENEQTAVQLAEVARKKVMGS